MNQNPIKFGEFEINTDETQSTYSMLCTLTPNKYRNNGPGDHANAENARKKQNIKIRNHFLKSFVSTFPSSN